MPEEGDTKTTVVLIAADGQEVAVGHLPHARPDLALVDALARLRLAAGRRHCTVTVRGASPELRGLLDLVGLTDVIVVAEPRRQPELGEQLGIDEVVQPGDPAG